jgi:hypothetical protein
MGVAKAGAGTFSWEIVVSPPENRSATDRRPQVTEESRRWQLSDGVLFGVLSSLLLWSLILAGVHATLT